MTSADPAVGGCPAGYQPAYQKSVQTLPWSFAGDFMKHDKSFAGLMSKPGAQRAPEILFVTIARNNNADNAFEEVIPSSFRLPNLIVAGAVDQAGDETNFTSYGDNVLIHADGQAVQSVVPGGAKIKMTGTSMAAPQVTNLAAQLLAVERSAMLM